jgi:hypothetical protein
VPLTKRYQQAFRQLGIALCALLWLCACGEQAQVPIGAAATYTSSGETTAGLVRYEDDTVPFAIDLPSDWFIGQLDRDEYALLATSSNKVSEPRAAIAVVVEPLDEQTTLSDGIATAESTFRAQSGIDGFRVDLARTASVNGVAAEERLYSYDLAQTPVRQRTLYVRSQSNLYAISLIAPPSLSARYDAVFSDVLASFTGA